MRKSNLKQKTVKNFFLNDFILISKFENQGMDHSDALNKFGLSEEDYKILFKKYEKEKNKKLDLIKTSVETMSSEQKFFFDLKGWIMLPSILSHSEINDMRSEVYSGATNGYEGALQTLLDHPKITGILSEILSEEPFIMFEDSYGFRCENSFTTVRSKGWETKKKRADMGLPHVVRPPQQANAMRYQVAGKKIFSGLTRVVWELEGVKKNQGGTSFLSGSHKAHFNYGNTDPFLPDIRNSEWKENIINSMEHYSCPPGSAIIFTESLLHAANDWTNKNNPRCAVFNCYNSIWANWHKIKISHEIIKSMPKKRSSLFRGIWEIPGENREYSKDNNSL